MKNSLVLFNASLRIADNPAFFYAAQNSQEILPLFILDEKNCREFGETSKWFLHKALESFSAELKNKYQLKLIVKKGDSLEILKKIFEKEKITALYLNNAIEPDISRLYEEIEKLSVKNSVNFFSFNSQTLFDPEKIKNGSGNYFKVFTPFWKECLRNAKNISLPLSSPDQEIKQLETSLTSDDLELLPRKNWHKKLEKFWKFDYKEIKKDLKNFLKNKSSNYKSDRDFPELDGTSKFSSYLHFGMISIREIFYLTTLKEQNSGLTQFVTELGWREFCHHLLFHFKELPKKNFRPEFDKFPWIYDEKILQKWQKGQTGFPIVDAGMCELWETGFMHNRVRMIVASFLIKDLLIDWRKGEEWFWNCLTDANLASNCANWQWVAGSGADAAPYFRIFNPTLQGERFDPEGKYVKKWLPQLEKLPKKFIHAPWLADEKTLEYCNIKLGKNYPKPIVDHAKARDMALMIFKNLK